MTRLKWSSAGSFPYYICALVYDFILYLIYTEADLEGTGVRRDFCNHSFFCDYFEELQTVLIKVKLIINNAPLTRLPNYFQNIFNIQPFVIWQTAIAILMQHRLWLGI